MMRSWRPAGLILFFGAILTAFEFIARTPAAGVTVGVAMVVLAWLLSPLLYPRSVSAAVAQQRSAEDGLPIVYWRPGCPFCLRLRAGLFGVTRRAHWVNIWTDPEGAAAVRAVADGNETVPTVIDAAESFVNPGPWWLRKRLSPAGRPQ